MSMACCISQSLQLSDTLSYLLHSMAVAWVKCFTQKLQKVRKALFGWLPGVAHDCRLKGGQVNGMKGDGWAV